MAAAARSTSAANLIESVRTGSGWSVAAILHTSSARVWLRLAAALAIASVRDFGERLRRTGEARPSRNRSGETTHDSVPRAVAHDVRRR
jgi:hypothetical protein